MNGNGKLNSFSFVTEFNRCLWVYVGRFLTLLLVWPTLMKVFWAKERGAGGYWEWYCLENLCCEKTKEFKANELNVMLTFEPRMQKITLNMKNN